MAKKIRTLLFDLGGVIMDIRRSRCVEALQALGMDQADALLDDYAQQGIFLALERGEITLDEFFGSITPMFSRPVSRRQITEALEKFLVGIPTARLRALEELRGRGLGVAMLSNTNALFWDGFIEREFRRDGHDREHYFPQGMIASFKVRAYKPDAEIFRIASRQLGLDPEETLFLDDSEANCRAARALGFQAEVVPPGAEFIDIVNERLARD